MFLNRQQMFNIIMLSSYMILFIPEASSLPQMDNYYYSNNVTEATNKFVAACRSANGSIEYLNHTEKGLYGEQLQATVCAVGNSAYRSVVYTISGTHGIEGYAGSMAQISMLRGSSSMYPDGVRMVHLHFINPYGASYILKENEQNADQSKNEAMYYTLDYDNPILQQLIDGIDLPHMENATVQQNAFALFGQLMSTYGPEAVNLALKTGQGKRPQGIAYFGPSKSWSSMMEDYVVDKYLRNATNIFVIDWHTAVGPYGNWSFMPIDNETEAFFKRWAPDDLMAEYDIGIPTGGQLQFSSIKGKTGAKRVLRGIWEAGTYNTTMSTNADFFFRLYCRFYSNSSNPFCADVISRIKEYFYPQGPEWKNLTYTAINNVLPKVLSGFANETNFSPQLVVFHWFTMVSSLILLRWL